MLFRSNFYLDGRLNLDDMISRRGKIEDVNEAFRAMKSGERSMRSEVACGALGCRLWRLYVN